MLLNPVTSNDTFRFVASATTQGLLLKSQKRSSVAKAIEYQLTITRIVPLSEQQSPARTFLSPTVANLAPAAENFQRKDKRAPEGQLQRHRFVSKLLGNERNVWLYQSPDFDATDPDAVLLIHFDGHEYTHRVSVPVMLDNLVNRSLLPPVAAVFIDNVNRQSRGRELPDNPLFAKALAEEFVPWVQSVLNIKIPAARRVLSGSSYGGLAATSIALRYPEQFGNVLSMSGSFWWSPPGTPAVDNEYIASWIASTETRPLRFFLSAGLIETSGKFGNGILESNRHVRHVLKAKGYPFYYREYAGGHDYFVWQEAFVEGMLSLFGGE